MSDVRITDLTQIADPVNLANFFLALDDGTASKKASLAKLQELISNPLTFNNAGLHNSIYRGKNLGTSLTAAQQAEIAAGTFKDMFIGDYWVINGYTWRIAAFDYWLHTGDTECTTHHVVIVPDENLLVADGSTTHYMNTSNVTTGGYVGTGFYSGTNADNTSNTAKATCKSKATAAFGSSHILTHREYLTNAVTDGHASAGSWYDSDVELMNEKMVYGCEIFEPAGNGTVIPAKYTVDKCQLPLFAHDPSKITNRANWWLRDVVSASYFAIVYNYGYADCHSASLAYVGVRPAFAIK